MKIIFLDIDGVVNCITTEERIPDHRGYIGVEQEKIGFIKQIVEATGAELVLSSTWRLDWIHNTFSWHYLRDEFKKQGLLFTDHTPVLRGSHRGTEIQKWLDSHIDEIEAYVVIDDDIFDIWEMHEKHLIETSWEHGLIPEDVEKAIKILTTKAE